MAAERALERRIVTVLFGDLVGFTSLSEALDPEDLVGVQDAYFAAVRETVTRYGGALEKFIGDAAVAVFGIPRVRDDDAARAVRAALALTSAVDQLGARVGLAEGDLRLRVGVNTGEVVYGEGSAERGPVTGDTVNVAARLQAAAPPGGILVGEATALAVEGSIVLERVGGLELKGKATVTLAWQALAEEAVPSRELAMRGIRAPMLGRGAELTYLQALVHETGPGNAKQVFVVAPPGVGKTRLLAELAATLPDVAVLRARLRPDVLTPYDGVAQLLADGLARASATLAEAAARGPRDLLEQRVQAAGRERARAVVVAEAALAVLNPAGREPRGADPRDRDVVFAAWLEALDALAGGARALWIVEDGHWASGDLLAFLGVAGASPAACGRVVLISARPVIREWLADCDAAVVELPTLSAQDTAGLVEALVGDALPTALVERVARASDGNPLFVEELLRSWVGSGLLERIEDGWRLRGDSLDVAVPSTVQTIYAAQLDDLPPPARRAARRAAVAGRRFSAAAFPSLDVGDAAEALDVLTRRALIGGPWSDPVFGSTYVFRHALLRDAGYASLARAERASLHIRLARWLEDVAGGSGQFAEIIGRHYAAALENAPRLASEVATGVSREEAAVAAARWFELGAEAALEVAAHETARALLARALSFTPEDATLDVARRRRRLGEAIAPSADMDEAAAELEQALELAARLVDSDSSETREAARVEYVAATVALGWVYNQQVRFDDAARLAAEALEQLGEADDERTARLLLLRANAVGLGTDEVAGPLADARRALKIARRAGATAVELDALFGLALDDEEGDERTAALRRVHRLALEIGRWRVAVSALTSLALLMLEHDPSATRAALEEGFQLASAYGLVEEAAWIDYARAETALFWGDWAEALEAGLRAAELAEAHGYRRAAVRSWYVVLAVAGARDDADLLRRGHDFSARFRLHFPSVPAPWARVMSTAADLRFDRVGLPRTALYDVDHDAALPCFDEPTLLPSWLEASEVVVEAWLEAGAIERVDEALKRLSRGLGRARKPSPTVAAFGQLLRGRWHRRLGEQGMAAVEARAAAEVFACIGTPAWTARSLRLLEAADATAPGEIAEAAELEARLGVVR